jgi:hypothetical protein
MEDGNQEMKQIINDQSKKMLNRELKSLEWINYLAERSHILVKESMQAKKLLQSQAIKVFKIGNHMQIIYDTQSSQEDTNNLRES